MRINSKLVFLTNFAKVFTWHRWLKPVQFVCFLRFTAYRQLLQFHIEFSGETYLPSTFRVQKQTHSTHIWTYWQLSQLILLPNGSCLSIPFINFSTPVRVFVFIRSNKVSISLFSIFQWHEKPQSVCTYSSTWTRKMGKLSGGKFLYLQKSVSGCSCCRNDTFLYI